MVQNPHLSRRPPIHPAPTFPPHKPALFARTPPAVFPVVLGLLGLGLALRRGLVALTLPAGLGDLLLGAAGALWLFCACAYAAKLIRRPRVLAEEMRVLPGRAGVAAATAGGMALAAALVPHAPGLAAGLLILSLGAHLAQAVVLVAVLRGLSAPARVVNPSLHLTFVGPIIGALAAVDLGWTTVSVAIFWATLPVALLIWGMSARQFLREVPSAPLRPMLAIHLAPASLLASVAALTGQTGVAMVFAGLGGMILLAFIAGARWLTASGFSAMWGSLTFPLCAYAAALLTLGWVWPGIIVLIAALGLVPAIAWPILKSWPAGSLASRTNAAEA